MKMGSGYPSHTFSKQHPYFMLEGLVVEGEIGREEE
jgi:hypothetical protein